MNIEENILNREFTADNSNEKWVTVITHLQYGFVGITRSMSRVGNCIDNAPIESFFGYVKCESYDLKHYKTYEELTEAIDQYIKFYNKERYQEKLNSLAPLEYRYQAIA